MNILKERRSIYRFSANKRSLRVFNHTPIEDKLNLNEDLVSVDYKVSDITPSCYKDSIPDW